MLTKIKTFFKETGWFGTIMFTLFGIMVSTILYMLSVMTLWTAKDVYKKYFDKVNIWVPSVMKIEKRIHFPSVSNTSAVSTGKTVVPISIYHPESWLACGNFGYEGGERYGCVDLYSDPTHWEFIKVKYGFRKRSHELEVVIDPRSGE